SLLVTPGLPSLCSVPYRSVRLPIGTLDFYPFPPTFSHFTLAPPAPSIVPLFHGTHRRVEGRVAHGRHSVLCACVGGYMHRAAQSAHQTRTGGPLRVRRRLRSPPGPAPPDGPGRRRRSHLGGDRGRCEQACCERHGGD